MDRYFRNEIDQLKLRIKELELEKAVKEESTHIANIVAKSIGKILGTVDSVRQNALGCCNHNIESSIEKNTNAMVECLGSMMNVSAERQQKISRFFTNDTLSEFCTIKIKGARQSGHSTAIFDLIQRSKSDPTFLHTKIESPIVVYPSSNILKYAIKSAEESGLRIGRDLRMVSISQILSQRLRGRYPARGNTIIVDGASILCDDDRFSVQSLISATQLRYPAYLIFVG